MASAFRLLRPQSYQLTHRSLQLSSWLAAESTVATSLALPPTSVTNKRKHAGRKAPQPKPTLKTESLLEKSPLHDFLDKVESSKDVISLTEIEYYKPKSIPDPDSPQYEVKYNQLLASLMESFTLQQLQAFSKSYNLATPSRQRKVDCITAIVEKRWGWSSLAKVKEARGDWTEISESQFPLDPEQSFLLMGRGGADLLSLSKRYNLHFSFSVHPMSLTVKGLRGSIKEFETYLRRFKNDLDVENVSLPLGHTLSSALLKSISTLSGAYVETEGNNQLRIVFHRSRPETFGGAIRLAFQALPGSTTSTTRALCESNTSLNDQQSGVQINSPLSYSLYPFSPPQPLSWKLSPTTAFRLRRVGHWLDMDLRRDTAGLARLAKGGGSVLLLNNESVIDTKAHLLQKLNELSIEPFSLPLITASTGHFLFLSLEHGTFVPPLAGQVEMNILSQWITDFSDRTLFNHSLPASLVLFKVSKEHYFRRLVYIAHSRHIGSAISGKSLTLEITDRHTLPSDDPYIVAQPCLSEIACFKKAEVSVDLLIPDYRADIRFAATNIEKLTDSHWPDAVKMLVDQLKLKNEKKFDIPVMFNHENLSYVLHSNSYVRQRHHEGQEAGERSRGTFLSETIIDSDSGQSSVMGKLLCKNYETETAWRSFLKQCDHLIKADQGKS